MLCSALLATTKLPLTWLWLSRVGSVTSTESTSTRPRPRPSRLPFDLFRSSFCDCCYFILHLRSTIFIIIYSYWITVFLDHYSFIHYSPPRPAALTSAPGAHGRAEEPLALVAILLGCTFSRFFAPPRITQNDSLAHSAFPPLSSFPPV